MALRSVATTNASPNGAWAFNAPAGYQPGDVLLAVMTVDGSQTLTADGMALTGFTKLGEITAFGGDTQNLSVWWRVATGAETWTATNTSGTTRNLQVAVGAYTGMDTAQPTLIQSTQPANGASSPKSIALTGVTCAGGESVFLFIGLDQQSQADVFTFDVPSGYSKDVEFSPSNWGSVLIERKDSVTAGTQGNVTVTATRTSGSNGADIAGFVVAIPSATPPTPTITAQPTDQRPNVGDTATFTVTASNATGYQWRKNGTNIGGATSASYTTPAASYADQGASFDCVVSNASGSVTSSAALLLVGANLSGTGPRVLPLLGYGPLGAGTLGTVIRGTYTGGGGAVALAGTGTLTATATATLTTQATLAGAGQAAAVGLGTLTVRAALVGTGALSASASGSITAAAALSGAGQAAASALGTLTLGASQLSGTGRLDAAGIGTLSVGGSGVALTGTGTLALGGSASLTTRAALAGAGMLSIDSSAAFTTRAALAGAGILSLDGQGSLTTRVALAGTALVGASGQGSLTTFAALSGAGSVSASGQGALVVAAALAGTGTLTATSTAQLAGTGVMLAGTGALTISGSASLTTRATLAGSGSLSAAGQGTLTLGASQLSGTGQVTFFGVATLGNGVALAGTGIVAASGQGVLTLGAPVLSGSGSLVLSGVGALAVRAALAGTGQVGAIGTASLTAAGISLAGVGTLTASGTGTLTLRCAFSGMGQIGADAAASLTTRAALAGTGRLDLSASSALSYAGLQLSGTGALTASAQAALATRVALAAIAEAKASASAYLSVRALLVGQGSVSARGVGYLSFGTVKLQRAIWFKPRRLTWTFRKNEITMQIEKTPGEAPIFDFDCSRSLPAGVTLQGTPTFSVVPNYASKPLTFGTPSINVDPIEYTTHQARVGTVIQVVIGGGIGGNPGNRYQITMRASTSRGDVWEQVATLLVTDKPQ